MDATRRVLIIDHSKVVRSALAKHLHGHYDVREEQDGESAWQTLVLDPTIIAVVAGAHLARLNSYELLTRLRNNKIRRICDIPFLLVVSGSESEQDRELGLATHVGRIGIAAQRVLPGPVEQRHHGVEHDEIEQQAGDHDDRDNASLQ